MMKKLFMSTVGCLAAMALTAQQINLSLKKELDSIYELDQRYRLIVYRNNNAELDSLATVYGIKKEEVGNHLTKLLNDADSSNIKRIEAIIQQYGYPGKSLVGEPTNEAAFYVIQHSTVIDQYLPAIKKAADKKELPFARYAMMLDRSLMYQGKEQVYGTQGKGMVLTDPATGKKGWHMFIWPVKDVAHVNERRKKAGFEQTIEESAKKLGITYQLYTLEDVKKMSK